TDAGVNVPVAFFGRPCTCRSTAPANPPVRDTETENAVVPPGATGRVAGVVPTVKSGVWVGWTTSVAQTPCERPPLVPTMRIWRVIAGVDADVVTVSVAEVDPAGIVCGAKAPEAPFGSRRTVSETAPAKPFVGPMSTVYVVESPGATVREPGDAAIVKFGF